MGGGKGGEGRHKEVIWKGTAASAPVTICNVPKHRFAAARTVCNLRWRERRQRGTQGSESEGHFCFRSSHYLQSSEIPLCNAPYSVQPSNQALLSTNILQYIFWTTFLYPYLFFCRHHIKEHIDTPLRAVLPTSI